MRIAFICNEIPPAPHGGIGVVVKHLATALSEIGNDVSIIGAYDQNYNWWLPPSIQVHVVKNNRRFFERFIQKFWGQNFLRQKLGSKLRRLHSQHPFSIIEWPDYLGSGPAYLRGAIEITRLHMPGFIMSKLRGEPSSQYDSFEKKQLASCQFWITPSQWMLDQVVSEINYTPLAHKIISNPVDFRHFNTSNDTFQKPTDTLNVLYAGSLIPGKGIFALAEASNIFLRAFQKSAITFVGRNFGNNNLKILDCIEPELRCRVNILHPLKQFDLAQLMRRSAIFAFPSPVESFGNVLAEAMACGLPIVAGNSTSTPEIVPDGQAGILVDPNDPKAIANAIGKLLGDQALRLEMGKFATCFAAANYSIQKSAVESNKFYTDCLSKLRLSPE